MFGERIKQLEKFAQGTADIQLLRNPLATKVEVVLNETVRDQYQDPISREFCRLEKIALVNKKPSISYVQELFDDLLEDDLEKLPWTVAMTMTGFPRRPSMDDVIVIDGIKYSISKVKPANRRVQTLIWIAVYPERTNLE